MKEHKKFGIMKSIVGHCICHVLNLVDKKIDEDSLNKLSNVFADKIISELSYKKESIPSGDKYDYFITFSEHESRDKEVEFLNSMGRSAWELVETCPVSQFLFKYIFKRKITWEN